MQQLGEICNFEELVQREELQSHGSRWGELGRERAAGKTAAGHRPDSRELGLVGHWEAIWQGKRAGWSRGGIASKCGEGGNGGETHFE